MSKFDGVLRSKLQAVRTPASEPVQAAPEPFERAGVLSAPVTPSGASLPVAVEAPESRGKSTRKSEFSQLKAYVPRPLHRALKLRAVQEEREISELVEEALKRYLAATGG
jgi:hypothetical protein